jgi:hypothetical protein
MVGGFFDPVEGVFADRLDRYRYATVVTNAAKLAVNPSTYRFGGDTVR